MPLITITCPHCHYAKGVERDRIPAGRQRVTCPECRQPFAFDNDTISPATTHPPLGHQEQTCLISCPECGYSREIEPGKIPPGSRATCPVCRHSFIPSDPSPPSPDEIFDAAPRLLNFTFTGKSTEYFGIWIVNNLLRILTLGIYSPWAKVRKRRYFYANTLLDNTPFDYLADPLALLRGWLIAVATFVLYSFVSNVSPSAGSTLGIALFLAMPWAIVRSRLFNMRSSAHRNVRFDFNPDYQEAYIVFAVLPFLTPMTLGLLFPYTLYRQKKFMMENGRFGVSYFTFEATSGSFYRIFLNTVGWIVFAVAITATLFSLFDMPSPDAFGGVFIGVILSSIFLLYLLAGVYVYVETTNLAWNTTSISGHRFHSDLRTRDLAWIFATNTLAAFLSFGLLIPWCAVRLARYRCSRLSLETHGSLDTFMTAQNEEVSATGEELGDIFGLEIGL